MLFYYRTALDWFAESRTAPPFTHIHSTAGPPRLPNLGGVVAGGPVGGADLTFGHGTTRARDRGTHVYPLTPAIALASLRQKEPSFGSRAGFALSRNRRVQPRD
jgi:hypothetical protein